MKPYILRVKSPDREWFGLKRYKTWNSAFQAMKDLKSIAKRMAYQSQDGEWHTIFDYTKSNFVIKWSGGISYIG